MSMETETRSAPDLSLLSETFLCAKMKGTSTELPSADETRNRPNRAKIRAWRAIGVAGADTGGILELVGRSGREEKRRLFRSDCIGQLSATTPLDLVTRWLVSSLKAQAQAQAPSNLGLR